VQQCSLDTVGSVSRDLGVHRSWISSCTLHRHLSESSAAHLFNSRLHRVEINDIVNKLLPVGRKLDAVGRVRFGILGSHDLSDLGLLPRLARGGISGLLNDGRGGHFGAVTMV
jgi:hypothetical protein